MVVVSRKIDGGPIWYICDLKIDKAHRANWIPYKMLTNSIKYLSKSNKVYAISMNNEQENKIVRLAKRIPLLNFKEGPLLMIYSFDYNTSTTILPSLVKHKDPINKVLKICIYLG